MECPRRAADPPTTRSLLSSARAIAERLYDEGRKLGVEVPIIRAETLAV